ncbi:ethanolamine ammonia-lyase reactivating factor EutA [Psychrobacillus sp. INOP01]|uniref:ethanolamine ammonia-lyase reactivating factor EutA n=1 Tax=Psychrobacillus sp. INOP01 TaxID=2829187 RepID=UPI001BA5C30C|nr:ethanolamine ammonia-lyase reactivating factor EutA [Psychrobacillus sp. INOP01]QUG43563.1 ethanolamine ammonia-lyase reactivating factor EutA [Psychrobacillus sp. INOP01]
MINFNQKKETIISAGIDIGTSTTKLIISRFSLMNTAGTTHVPRIEIIDKEIIYKSPIFRTPLKNTSTIHVSEIEKIIRTEYAKAGIKSNQIETGAVIITGETATKQNAREMLHYLSDEVGDFLVATAGPDLEGIIAAKGSGAYEYSSRSKKVIANIDIGGGTANIAVYKDRELLGTCTMHIGGRLIEFEDEKIKSISPPVQRLLESQGISLHIGDSKTSSEIQLVVQFMAESLSRILKNEVNEIDQLLLLGHSPNWKEAVDTIVLSGGIAECVYNHEVNAKQIAKYDDIGQELARELQRNESLRSFTWFEPIETVRATVLGAGTQTTEISGATIQVSPSDLPLKNVPVYSFNFHSNLQQGLADFDEEIRKAIDMYDATREGQNFALYISELPYMGFRDIQKLSKAIIQVMEKRPEPLLPIVLVLQTDHAKVIGQTLLAMRVRQSVICIDQVSVDHGDYMDIGKALDSGVVPVVVKTLTFHSS